MGLTTLTMNHHSLNTLLDEILYTYTRLKADGTLSALLSTFDTLLKECKKALDTEQVLHEKIVSAEAVVDWCDDQLDRGVDALSSTLLKITQGDRSHVLYQRYFGSIRPSDLKKPVLGEELETVRKWIDSLKSSTHKEIQDLGSSLEAIVKSSDAAAKELESAREKMADFRTTGDRFTLFEKTNAARKLAYGTLSQRSFDLTDKKSVDFAEQFFVRVRTKKRSDPSSMSQLKTRIEQAQNQLQELQTQYDALQTQAEMQTKLEAEYKAELKRLAETEKAREESAKKAAELKEKLGKR